MRWAFAVVLTLSACRFGFGTVDDDVVDSPKVYLDAKEYLDAPLAPFCTPLGVVVTAEQCATAYADPAAAPDQVLFDCADACALHACILFEGAKDGCSSCVCNAYIKSSVICDDQGACGPPLSGTGCVSAGGYTSPPWNCPANLTLQETTACALRVLIALGDC